MNTDLSESNFSKNEIIKLENKYWDAMRSNDVETAVSLTRFPCILTSPKGVQHVSEDQYREMMKADKGDKYKGINLLNPQVDVLNDDAALITYNIEMNGMQMLDTSTWIRENGKWICAYHSENQIQ